MRGHEDIEGHEVIRGSMSLGDSELRGHSGSQSPLGVMKLHIIMKKFSARNMGSESHSRSWSLIISSFHKVIHGKKGHSWHFGSRGQ
jgi:hypothetical protein